MDDQEELEPMEEEEFLPEPRPEGWATAERTTAQPVFVDVGRGGQPAPVNVGDPFPQTIERLSDEANYGGWFRVWLNGNEIVEPEDAPATIEEGMRIAITSYDKVGAA